MAVTPVDCATYVLSTLLLVQCAVLRGFDGVNSTATYRLCNDDVRQIETQGLTAVPPHGLVSRWDMVAREECPDAQMIHCDSACLFRNIVVSCVAQRQGTRLRRRRQRELCVRGLSGGQW